jgi:hypothetical protein
MYLCGQMYRSTQAKKKFRQITWLVLGVCFVLLYSCPVKKFLIICLDKIPPADNATAQFMKAYSAPGVKISYLHKDATVYAVPSAGRSVRPIDPSSFLFCLRCIPGPDQIACCSYAPGRYRTCGWLSAARPAISSCSGYGSEACLFLSSHPVLSAI